MSQANRIPVEIMVFAHHNRDNQEFGRIVFLDRVPVKGDYIVWEEIWGTAFRKFAIIKSVSFPLDGNPPRACIKYIVCKDDAEFAERYKEFRERVPDGGN